LHEYALLLKYFNHYNAFHDFKNALKNYYIKAKDLNQNDIISFAEEFESIKKIWNIIDRQIQIDKDEIIK